jgi:hypothetical protein
LSSEQIGREIYYQVQTKKLKEVSDWIEPFKAMWETKFTQLDKVLKQIKK